MAKSARKHNAPWTPADLKKMRATCRRRSSPPDSPPRNWAAPPARSSTRQWWKGSASASSISPPACSRSWPERRNAPRRSRRPTKTPRTGVRGGFAVCLKMSFPDEIPEQTARRRHHDLHRDVAPRRRTGRGQCGTGLPRLSNRSDGWPPASPTRSRRDSTSTHPWKAASRCATASPAKIVAAGGRAVDPETEITVTCGGTEVYLLRHPGRRVAGRRSHRVRPGLRRLRPRHPPGGRPLHPHSTRRARRSATTGIACARR